MTIFFIDTHTAVIYSATSQEQVVLGFVVKETFGSGTSELCTVKQLNVLSPCTDCFTDGQLELATGASIT